ncbi:hypothetical protein FJV80_07820 [Mesorhizobium sp. WSM4310]|uniref:hypothetical protein n=1 Tax=Mesorhizobium sp. WSM4310 TaxID=2589883 RepID=UPI00115CC3CE|nr:hypothetical protein [Mesorhizobium sp. WSM4310]TRC89691.1 hypothetical protein FJV80_07820 [Mesorhizobium sp. WSM4310]
MNSDVDYEDSDDLADDSFWTVGLVFYRPSKLSDEEMRWHFRGYDGRWSEQTQEAMSRLGAEGLDLNENWALAEQFWSCAGCGRSKNECFRLSKRGTLLAKLELHHDHIRDRIWPRADELLGADWRQRVPGGGDVLDIVRDLVSRFSYALICSQCNAAEGKAKSSIPDMHPRFTFTASEIRQFVIACPGQEHDVDLAKAADIWQAQFDAFQMRLALLDTLIGEMGAGRISNSNVGRFSLGSVLIGLDEREVISRALRDQIGRDDERGRLLSGYRDEFLTRSVSFDSRRLAVPVSARKSVGPSDEEYAAYVDPVSRQAWEAASQNWSCPCCGRVKRDVVRKGGKGKWSGGIRTVLVLVDETDSTTMARRQRLFPNFRNEVWVGDSYFVQVCSDCHGVQQTTRQQDRSAPESHLSLDDIRDSLIRITPNAPHEVDHEGVIRKLHANLSHMSAYEAYSAFRNLVSGMKGIMDYRMERGVPREAVLAELRQQLPERAIVSESEQAEFVDWLLSVQIRNVRD